MKIPRQIKIGGHIYEVRVEAGRDIGSPNCGTCQPAQNKIYIDITQPLTQQESTLLHEVIEAINWQQKIGLEENQICQLETGLYQVLKDNKLLK